MVTTDVALEGHRRCLFGRLSHSHRDEEKPLVLGFTSLPFVLRNSGHLNHHQRYQLDILKSTMNKIHRATENICSCTGRLYSVICG